MPARPGAFTANFAPETLNKFRETCKRSGLQYTKVLEELATLYLDSKGSVLEHMVVQEKIAAQIETFEKLIEYLDSKEFDDIETKKELQGFIWSTKYNPRHNEKIDRLHASREVQYARMSDPSIDSASPPDELTKWEEGYSDIFKKMKVMERKIWDEIRDTDHKYSTAVTGLKKQVSALEEQLSKLQSEVSD